MKYEYSPEIEKVLNKFDCEVIILMKFSLRNFFENGIEPHFESVELRDLWFYCKVHELSHWIQRKGYMWYGSYEHYKLKDLLDRCAAKISNRHYFLGERNGCN